MDNTVGVTLALYVNSSVCFSMTVIFELCLSFELQLEFICVFDGAVVISSSHVVFS